MAIMDNGTMVEVFKSLNYMQLAKNSLVSKRFWNLIRTNRHRLALLYVDSIYMVGYDFPHPYAFVATEIFNKKFSSEEYNKWVIRNNYSKKIPLEGQVAGIERTLYGGKLYEMKADYKDPIRCGSKNTTPVFFARIELNHCNWPLFQHFVRILTDPFIYISYLKLTPGIETAFLNLLAGAMNSDQSRLRCDQLIFHLDGSIQKFISWIKDHVLCNDFRIYKHWLYHGGDSIYYQDLLELFVTGAHCTSSIMTTNCGLSNVVVSFVQKFLDLKNGDESHGVEFIRSYSSDQAVKVLKRKYAQFMVKDERNKDETVRTQQLFELINDDIGKKLQITTRMIYNESYFSLKITNL